MLVSRPSESIELKVNLLYLLLDDHVLGSKGAWE